MVTWLTTTTLTTNDLIIVLYHTLNSANLVRFGKPNFPSTLPWLKPRHIFVQKQKQWGWIPLEDAQYIQPQTAASEWRVDYEDCLTRHILFILFFFSLFKSYGSIVSEMDLAGFETSLPLGLDLSLTNFWKVGVPFAAVLPSCLAACTPEPPDTITIHKKIYKNILFFV